MPKLQWARAKEAWDSTAFVIWSQNEVIPTDELIAQVRARAEAGTFGFYEGKFVSEWVTVDPATWQRLEAECRRRYHHWELDRELDGRLLDRDYLEVT